MVGTSRYDAQTILTTYRQVGESVRETAKRVGCAQSTVRLMLQDAGVKYGNTLTKEAPPPPVSLPEFPDDDIPTEEIIEQMVKRFGKRQTYQKAKDWFPVKVNIKGPIGITFWGDPHVDDDGCNWPLLNHHCDLHRANSALFSVNIGDTINNWSDRLAKLYANQETSLKTAKKLAQWFLKDSGIRWICWLAGNHDLWTDFTDYLRAQNVARVPMEDWQARFRVVFPNGREAKIWASHNFAGHSQFNTLHGPQKAAHSKAEADIYAAGHTHNWAIHQEESGSRDFTYWLIRSRGYKYIDDYALKLGHFPQEEGASITCIIDPDTKSQSGFIQAFADMDAATDYLGYLRKRK
jgi:hypothetical protein